MIRKESGSGNRKSQPTNRVHEIGKPTKGGHKIGKVMTTFISHEP